MCEWLRGERKIASTLKFDYHVLAMESRKVAPILASIAIAAGVLVHFLGIGSRALWYDEVTTAAYAWKSAGDLWSFLAAKEVHPPLFFFVSKLALMLPLPTEWSLRLVPLAASLAAIGLVEGIARRAFGVRYAGAVLAAWVPGLVIYGQEARAYAPLAALELAAIYALVRLHSRPGERRWAALAAVAMFLAAASSYFAILFLIPLAAALLMWAQDRRFAFACLAAAALAYAPWLPVAAQTFFGNDEALQHAAPRMLTVADYLGVLAFHWGHAVAAAAMLAAAVLVGWSRRGEPIVRLWLALAVLPLLFFAALPPRYPYFTPRYLIAWAVLPLVLAPAVFALSARRARKAGVALVALALVAMAPSAVSAVAESRVWNAEIGTNAAALFDNGDVLIVDPYYQSAALLYYLPIAPERKALLLDNPLQLYDGVQVAIGGKSIVLTSFGALTSVLSNMQGLSGNLWVLGYGPDGDDRKVWATDLSPIRTYEQATLYRVITPLRVDKDDRIYVGFRYIGSKVKALPAKLP